MRPCEKCLNNSWDLRKKKEVYNGWKEKWIQATCKVCGYEVEFGHRKTKAQESPVAHYKIKDGKHFLKIDGEFVEVGLGKTKKGFKVMPVNEIRERFLGKSYLEMEDELTKLKKQYEKNNAL